MGEEMTKINGKNKTKLQKNWYWCGKKTCIYETLALPLCVGRFCASNFESLNI